MVYNKVLEYSKIFKHQIDGERSKSVLELRSSLMHEEWIETLIACSKGDLVEVIDGLADMVYVIVGAKIAFGLPVGYSNLHIDMGTAEIVQDQFPLKNDSFKHQLVLVGTYFQNYDLNIVEGNLIDASENLDNALIVIQKLSSMLGVDIRDAVDIVHASNMSKLGKDGQPIFNEKGKNLKGPDYVAPTSGLVELIDHRKGSK